MTLDIQVIDQNGNETSLSDEIYFNYSRNAYDFHNAMINNANINIRMFPFFPYDEFQKDVYPDSQRKKTMLYLTEQMKTRFQSKAEMILYIQKTRWRMDKDKFGSLLKKIDDTSIFLGEPKVVITLHQKSQSEKYHYLSKDYYDNWVDKFLQLILELMKEGNGFYVTD